MRRDVGGSRGQAAIAARGAEPTVLRGGSQPEVQLSSSGTIRGNKMHGRGQEQACGVHSTLR